MKINEEVKKTRSEKARGVSSAEGAKKKKSETEKISGEERLQKLLSRAGVASRRAAEALIADGQVSVNGHVVKELGAKADPLVDKITVSGKPLQISDAAPTVVLLHKPRGYMSTKSDPENRPIIMDLMPRKLQKLNPVGRLDFDTSGVLLLTDDGDLLHLLTHPSHGVEKVYHARVGGQVQLETVKILESGVHILEGDENSKTKIKTAPCRVRVRAQTEKNALVELTLREGRNRQVRKMLETMGHAVSSLRRIKFAGLEMEELPPGGYRLLLPGEIHALRKGATRAIAKKQSRADILKEASAAIEARERRNPRPKTPAKFVSRGKSSLGDSSESHEESAPRSRSTLARPVAPSRSTYGTKNKEETTGRSRPTNRTSSYEASGQETPRPYSPRAASGDSANSRTASPRTSSSRTSNPRTSDSRTTDSRSSAPRPSARPSSYQSGGEEKPRAYPQTRTSSRGDANPRNAAARASSASRPSTRPAAYKSAGEDKPHDYSSSRDASSPNVRPRNPTTSKTSSPRKPAGTKPEAPLGERIRRQWKND